MARKVQEKKPIGPVAAAMAQEKTVKKTGKAVRITPTDQQLREYKYGKTITDESELLAAIHYYLSTAWDQTGPIQFHITKMKLTTALYSVGGHRMVYEDRINGEAG